MPDLTVLRRSATGRLKALSQAPAASRTESPAASGIARGGIAATNSRAPSSALPAFRPVELTRPNRVDQRKRRVTIPQAKVAVDQRAAKHPIWAAGTYRNVGAAPRQCTLSPNLM